MKLELIRTVKAADHTEGKLSMDGLFFAYTLERPDDGKNTPFQSAIPEGTYPVTKRWSHKLGRDVLAVGKVPDRDDIEIHPANLVSELSGCIAPGMKFIATGFLTQSRLAFQHLMERFQEPCTLSIESVPDSEHV